MSLSLGHRLVKNNTKDYFTNKFGEYSSLLDRVDAIIWHIENPSSSSPPAKEDGGQEDPDRIKHNNSRPGMFGFQLQCGEWRQAWICYRDFIEAVISNRWGDMEDEEDIPERKEAKDQDTVDLYKEVVLYLIKYREAPKYLFDAKFFSTGDFYITFDKLFSGISRECRVDYCKIKMMSKTLEEAKTKWRNMVCKDIFDQIEEKGMIFEMEKHFDIDQCQNLSAMNSCMEEGLAALEFTMLGKDIKRCVQQKIEC